MALTELLEALEQRLAARVQQQQEHIGRLESQLSQALSTAMVHADEHAARGRDPLRNTSPPGAWALLGDLTPPQITADQNDYNPVGLDTASVLRISSDAARNITGLAGGADGRVLIIYNVGSFAIDLKDESASSSAANRFSLLKYSTANGISLAANASVVLWYDATTSRWRNTVEHTETHSMTGSHVLTGTRGQLVKTGLLGQWGLLGIGASGTVLHSDGVDPSWAALVVSDLPGHGISKHTEHANWKVLYTDGSGDEQELALGADGTFLQANGVAAAPTFAALVAGDIPATTQTIVLTAGGGGPTLTAAAGAVTQAETTTNDVNYWYIGFTKDVDLAAFWVGVLPNWDGGTFTYQVYWTAAAGTGDVVWGLKALSLRNDDALDTAWGTEVTVTDTLLATGDLHISPASTAVTPGGTRQEGNLLAINFAHRGTDGSDTFSDEARVLFVVITYTTGSYAD